DWLNPNIDFKTTVPPVATELLCLPLCPLPYPFIGVHYQQRRSGATGARGYALEFRVRFACTHAATLPGESKQRSSSKPLWLELTATCTGNDEILKPFA